MQNPLSSRAVHLALAASRRWAAGVACILASHACASPAAPPAIAAPSWPTAATPPSPVPPAEAAASQPALDPLPPVNALPWLEEANPLRPVPGVALQASPFGTSAAGNALMALRFSAAPLADAPHRPAVLLLAGQHGDDSPAGSQALWSLAQDIAAGRMAALLAAVDVVIVPCLDPDGARGGRAASAAGRDIALDHLMLQTPEARALAALLRDADPAVVIDLRAPPSGFDTPAPGLAVLQSSAADLRAFVDRAADEWFVGPLRAELLQLGVAAVHRKVPIIGRSPQDTLLAEAGLRNSIGLVLATRAEPTVDPAAASRLLLDALHSLLRSTTDHAADLAKVRAYVGREVAAQACAGDIGHEPADAPAGPGPDTAWRRPRPCGYWLAADADTAVSRLRLFGLRVDTLAKQLSALGSQYRGQAADPPGAGRIDIVDALIDMPAGSRWLPLDQPLAGLAIAALEPDTPHSFFQHGVLARLDQVARLRQPVDDHPVDIVERVDPPPAGAPVHRDTRQP